MEKTTAFWEAAEESADESVFDAAETETDGALAEAFFDAADAFAETTDDGEKTLGRDAVRAAACRAGEGWEGSSEAAVIRFWDAV